ncbi:MAG: hypothetical protein RML38_11710, partial [Bacteroidia bacterium]|nr:hypothetical protein [Bacteroidia bacterium]
VGIGTATPNASAMLDITATNRGLLIPRVNLTATNNNAPIGAGVATSLLVYNQATSGAGATAVTPGYYYWDGTQWVRLTDRAWLIGNSTATTNYPASTGFFGTATNQHIDFVTNNIVRGRLSNLGEFFIGAVATVLPGDLMNGVGNATFPWAVNGYTDQNGGGVYGSVTAGTTNFAAVQGEYVGTGTSGAGVRGSYMTNTAGTSFAACATGVVGTATTTGSYKFGVYGSGGTSTRSGGVMGYDYGIALGGLGYYSSGGIDFAVYGFGLNYTVGVPGGKIGSAAPNNMIGLGIYGGVMGGWIRGCTYGLNVRGERYSMYVDGKSYVNQPVVYLIQTQNTNRVPAYMSVSTHPEITDKGKVNLVNGRAVVSFKDAFKNAVLNIDDVIITVTPQGNTQGVYVTDITREGFTIVENNQGKSNVQVCWTASAPLKQADSSIPEEILENSFDEKMRGVMHNENAPENGKPIWWDGEKVRFDPIPQGLFQKDPNSLPNFARLKNSPNKQ